MKRKAKGTKEEKKKKERKEKKRKRKRNWKRKRKRKKKRKKKRNKQTKNYKWPFFQIVLLWFFFSFSFFFLPFIFLFPMRQLFDLFVSLLHCCVSFLTIVISMSPFLVVFVGNRKKKTPNLLHLLKNWLNKWNLAVKLENLGKKKKKKKKKGTLNYKKVLIIRRHK